MRIAWVIYGDLAQTTGGYIYDRLVIEGLRRGGDVVDVVSIAARGLRGVLRGPHLARTLTKRACDVVVGDELCFPELATAFPRLAGELPRVTLVHHLSSWEGPSWQGPSRGAVTRLERATLHASDAVVATSAPTAERLAREHDVKAAVAEPGADRLALAPRAVRLEREPLRLLFVGTLTPRKGVLTLLDALDRARVDAVHLTLAGDDTRDVAYAADVRAVLARSPWLAAHVTVAGPQADAKLAALLAASDALVLPSRFEGYGMVLTEALAAGLPVIATTAGAIPSVVRDSAEALLVPADDGAALAVGIARFAADPKLRASMGAAAHDRRATLPTWARTTASVRDVLAQAIAAKV